MIDATTNHTYKTHAHFHSVKDVNASEKKNIFMAHIITMGLVQKANMKKFWSTSNLSKTSFFGKFMLWNKFESVLWNLFIADNTENVTFG